MLASEPEIRRLPLALDVDPWMARGCEGARYSLASAGLSARSCPAKLQTTYFALQVVSHHGPVPDAGHYSSTVLVDTNWYTFNDDVVGRPDRQPMSRRVKLLYL